LCRAFPPPSELGRLDDGFTPPSFGEGDPLGCCPCGAVDFDFDDFDMVPTPRL
jgi:hypothetical protein